MSHLPKITIGIVTFNRKKYLQRTLDHVLADPYPNKEIIVIDGGSVDGTRELLESYGDRLTRWVSERDRGEYDAWNKLNALATGDIIKWLPDDDNLRHGMCQFAADWFAGHPETDLLWGQTVTWLEREFGKMERLSETQMTDPARLTKQHFLRQTHGVTSVALFIRRRAVDRIGPFRIDMACADTEYWVRAAHLGVSMAVVSEIFVDYTITGDNGQIKYAFKISRDLLRINRMYGTRADVLYTLWQRRWSVSGLTMLQHRLGQEAAKRNLHPLRAMRKLRARVLG